MITRISTLVNVLALLATAASLGACMGDGQQSVDVTIDRSFELEHTAKLVRSYMFKYPQGDVGKVTKVEVAKSMESTIVMEVLVSWDANIRSLENADKYQQLAILQTICPPQGSMLANMLGKDTTLWINLNSPKRRITGASCEL